MQFSVWLKLEKKPLILNISVILLMLSDSCEFWTLVANKSGDCEVTLMVAEWKWGGTQEETIVIWTAW